MIYAVGSRPDELMLGKNGFDRWAGLYDEDLAPRLQSFPFLGYYDVLSAVLARAAPQTGMRILDVGIGTGLLSRSLRELGCVIFGVDFSAKMLEKAENRIPGAHLDAVDVATDYLGRFSKERFDRIISSYFLHHLDPGQQLAFLRRALAHNLTTGGMIVIADVGFATAADHDAARERYGEAWDEEEFYLCGETIVHRLRREKIRARYEQISACAGVLICAP